MSTAVIVILGIALVVVLVLLARTAGRAYFRYRGTRIVTCPETERPVAVEADALRAATGAARGQHKVQLKDCTRWPERRNCGQECLTELEASPEGCLLRNILEDWYSGQSCWLCGKQFTEIQWHDHKPGLLDSENKVWEWVDFPPEKLTAVLEAHHPICWDCLIAEEFRRDHPGLVVDRS
jgi:hypothetical protein